jgi:diguanylate cyclase (GGDEF)-like protein
VEFLRQIKLRNKIFLLCTVLVMLTTLVIQASSWWSSNQFNLRQLEAEAGQARAVLTQYLDGQASLLVTVSKVLTADFGFVRAVATSDADTIKSALSNHAARIEADVMVLTDMSGHVLSSTTDDMSAANELSPSEVETLINNPNQAYLVTLGDKIYQLILSPVKAPHIIAYNIVGFEIDESSAAHLKSLTGFDISFFKGDSHLLSTTFRLPSFDAFRQLLNLQQSNWLLFSRPAHLTEEITLKSASELPVKVMLISSLAPLYQQYDRSLLHNFLLALLIAISAALLSIPFARSLTGPLHKLGEVAKAYAQGFYQKKVDIQGGEEIQNLHHNFLEMGREIKTREDKIRYQATHDVLTGLPNFYTIEERLGEALTSNRRLILINISIRNFRQINDRLGVDMADACLKSLAKLLNELPMDTVFSGRMEGAEFITVMRFSDNQAPIALVEDYLLKLENALYVAELNIKLDLSAGVALYPENGQEPRTLIRRTMISLDSALKQKQRVHCYEEGEDELHMQRLVMVEALRKVILAGGDNQLFMMYQPKINLDGSAYIKTEALIRWRREDQNLVSPEVFVNLAEEASLIVDLTRWVVDNVLHQLRDWHQQGQMMGVAINVSAQDLAQSEFESIMLACCEKYQVSPRYITIEITERDIMHDEASVVVALRSLKQKGFTIAIDDYGIGQSSLSKLKGLPVDEIKLDKSFIMQLDQSPKDQLIVRSTIELAHGLGYQVVAEGVENEASLALLKTFGCDQIQGYYLSKPLTADAVADWQKDYVEKTVHSNTAAGTT